MIRTQVSLEADMYRRVKHEAKRLGISVAEYLRRALARALGEEPSPGKRDKPWMRYSGVARSGDPDASRTVDEHVYGPKR